MRFADKTRPLHCSVSGDLLEMYVVLKVMLIAVSVPPSLCATYATRLFDAGVDDHG